MQKKTTLFSVMPVLVIVYALICLNDIFDITIPHADAVRFLGIMLCTLLAFSNGSIRLKTTFAFTVLADLFLLLPPLTVFDTSVYFLGVAFFIIAQTIRVASFGALKRWQAMCIAGMGILTAAALFLFGMDELIVLSLIYAALLLAAAVLSFFRRNLPTKNKICIRIGMLLFVACDICVALTNLLPVTIAASLIWVFYLPSQALLATEQY